MLLAVNYSPQAENLRRSGIIDVDIYKCPDWPDLISEAESARPVYVHFPLIAGCLSSIGTDWATLERLARETSTPFINVHLVAEAGQFPHIPVDSTSPAHLDEVTAYFLREVGIVAERFGAEKVIVENVIYRGPEGKVLLAAVASQVLARVTEESGCGLLLDLAHASISARHLGVGAQNYIAALPVNRLRELHVTGTRFDGQRWRDHLAMDEHDWALLDWAGAQISTGTWNRPWVAAFEYGGIGPIFEWRSDPAVIAEQIPRLRQTISGG